MSQRAPFAQRASLPQEINMRGIAMIMVSATLAACSTMADQPTRTAQSQQQYLKLLDGKIAGPSVSCLPTYRAGDMTVIDENTVVFRQSANRVYVGHFMGGCSNLGQAPYALLTKQISSNGMCHGDIAQVVDTHTGTTVGSCVIGDFTPYTRP